MALGDFGGDLDGVDGFAQVGVREQAAYLAFIPELHEQGHWVRHLGGIGEGVVDFFDSQHPVGLGVGLGFDFRRDGRDGIKTVCRFHPCSS